MIRMTPAIKKALVNVHNQKRNEIALGKVPNYDQASNMQTVEWDDDLAAKAALNVKQCSMTHDKCAPGQNLATSMTTGRLDKTPANLAKMAGGQWFDKEQKMGGYYGWMDLISQFNPGDTK